MQSSSLTHHCVSWLHEFEDEPVLLFSELDDHRGELRKVEVFRDGTQGYAPNPDEDERTGLSTEPLPPMHEIATDPVFVPRVISAAEFEAVWENRLSRFDFSRF